MWTPCIISQYSPEKDHRLGAFVGYLVVLLEILFLVILFVNSEIYYLDLETIRSKMMAEKYLTSHIVDLWLILAPDL